MILRVLFAIALLGAGCATNHAAPAASAQQPSEEGPPKLRLPAVARPMRYAADLTLRPDGDSFKGFIDIDIRIEKPIRVLWLNATELDICAAVARLGNLTKPFRVVPGGADFVGLDLGEQLDPGKLKVQIEYSGKVTRKDSRGVFAQREGDDWYLLSHFEAIDARRAFPCFDEPAYKAPWQLTLRVPKGQGAFSNTNPQSDTVEGEQRVVRFAPTLPLPSYLIAFAAGPFERVDAGKVGETPVGILALKGKADRTKYAVSASPKLLAILEEWFGMPYAYGKMDSIAVPLGGGAMEHPGLVTFGYQLLQARPEDDTASFRRRSAGVTAHEFAHQWFGDLVTTAWWDDIWLNEAFATWMTSKALRAYAPEWPAAEMLVSTRATALLADSLPSTRRIRQPIESNDDIANAFDRVTYDKGATVIAMFERWVGPERFRLGVQRYLKAHQHSSANAAQFLEAIAAEAGDKAPAVAAAFSTFLDQAGAPLVTERLSCGDGGARLELKQQRYQRLGAPAAEPQRWHIPICARWSAGGKVEHACTLLKDESGVLALGPACPDWVLPNDGMVGDFRSDPGEEHLDKLLAKADITSAERAGLLGDVGALVNAGRLPLARALAWVPAAARHPSRAVVEAAANLVSPLRENRLLPDDVQPQAAAFIRDTFRPAARDLGWNPSPDEDDERRLLRPEVLRLVGQDGEDLEIIAQARKIAAAWLADRHSAPGDIAGTALAVAAAGGDRAFFDELMAALKTSKERGDRTRILFALTQIQKPELYREALQLTLSDELDARESAALFGGFGRGLRLRAPAAAVAFEFVKQNFAALSQRMSRNFAGGVPSMFVSLCDDQRAEEIEATFGEAARKSQGGPRRLAQALEGMRLCAAFRKAQAQSAAEYLKARAAGPPSVAR